MIPPMTIEIIELTNTAAELVSLAILAKGETFESKSIVASIEVYKFCS